MQEPDFLGNLMSISVGFLLRCCYRSEIVVTRHGFKRSVKAKLPEALRALEQVVAFYSDTVWLFPDNVNRDMTFSCIIVSKLIASLKVGLTIKL